MNNTQETVTISRQEYSTLLNELFKMKLGAKFAYIKESGDYWEAIDEFYDENPDLFEEHTKTGEYHLYTVDTGKFLDDNPQLPDNIDMAVNDVLNHYIEMKEYERKRGIEELEEMWNLAA